MTLRPKDYQKAYMAKRRQDPEFLTLYRERAAKAAKDGRANPDTWAKFVLRNIKQRCKNNGTFFDLKPDQIEVPKCCPICFSEFVFGVVAHKSSPSLDRMRPDQGYTASNVSVICRSCNMIKQDCTDPEIFRRVADYVEASYSGKQNHQPEPKRSFFGGKKK